METTSKLDNGKLIATILAILVLLTSSIIPMVFAGTPPTIAGNEEYMNDDGVLDSHVYTIPIRREEPQHRFQQVR